MITYIDKEWTDKELNKILCDPVEKWFKNKYGKFCKTQRRGLMNIQSRKNTLISAPTGSGKTMTAFLSILNELTDNAMKGNLKDKIYCVYSSPLKALNRDIQFNLTEPLKEIEEIVREDYGIDKLGIRVLVRSGDTTAKEKAQMLKEPPHILITTPESLAIVLSSIKFKEHLTDVDWLIIDEIHSLAENKRGVHMSLSVERLERLCGHMTRIGLSATISPLMEIGRYLAGYKSVDNGRASGNISTSMEERDCDIVDVKFIKEMDLKVVSPVDNIINVKFNVIQSKTFELLHKYIQDHRTTIIFTNTRSGTERVVDSLKDLYPKDYSEENIGAHHGSLSKEYRETLEGRLREGKMKCVVSSTSLELGIDIGFVDLVILLGSPKSVARALQRTGRSGHQIKSVSKGRIIVTDRDDLVECSVLLKCAMEHKIDRIHIPRNCLDVLTQHIVGIAVDQKISIDDLYGLIRSSYCFRNLEYNDFMEVLRFLAGEYVSLEERHIYAKIWLDEEERMIGRRGRMSRVIYMTNIGTIPEQTGIIVKIANQPIGTIEEDFLEKLKPGDIFVLGGSTYEFRYAKGQVAYVNTTVGRPPTVPSWYSEMLPLSYDLACEIGKFRRLMSGRFCQDHNPSEIKKFINEYLYVDERAVNAIYQYFREQFDYRTIPSDRRIIIEHYTDDKGRYVIFHSMFGRRVNDVLSRAVAFAVSRRFHRDVDMGINDNGFYIRADSKADILSAFRMLRSDELRKVVENAVDKTETLKRRFRHCASRALMILRSYKGHTKWVGRRQVDSMILLSAVRRISQDFVILKEARREVLEDLMDVNNAINVLKGIEDDVIKVEEIFTNVPSPFAFNLLIQGNTDILKMEDKHDFLKRMHRMVLAKIYLEKSKESSHGKIDSNHDTFDYDEYFDNELDDIGSEYLIEKFSVTARKVGLDAMNVHEGRRFLSGERDGFKDGFINWLKGLIDGDAPEIWDEDVIKYFKDHAGEL
ncbi:ATP-dependent helicase [Candidatus Woesearchaeota archaeon]|nr:ATP-dependent helicase [Candidatus Woesearchaeota archaeon]